MLCLDTLSSCQALDSQGTRIHELFYLSNQCLKTLISISYLDHWNTTLQAPQANP